MKRTILNIAAIIALVSTASCNKLVNPGEEVNSGEVVFTATIDEEDSKTFIEQLGHNLGNVFWEEKDEVVVNTSKFSVKPKDNAHKADLILKEGQSTPVAPYKAIYPADLYHYHQEIRYDLPSSIPNYTDGTFNAPMYAVSDTEHLTFKNICGVLCLNLTGTEVVDKITIYTNKESIYGIFTIDENFQIHMKEPTGNRTVDIYVNNVQLNSATPKQFYIFLPPNDYERGLKITIKTTNNKSYVKYTQTTMSIKRNSVYNISWQLGGPKPNYLPGRFSVSSSHQVNFAKGNLTYDGSSFKFEDNQHGYPTSWDPNHIGHFFWSKDASKARAQYYDDDEECSTSDVIFTNSSPTTPNPNFTVNGETGKFRCLSKDEWNYLLRERTVNGGRGKGHSYDISKNFRMGDVIYHGIVLYPDGYNSQVTYSSWEEFDASGVVFIPLLGYRTDEKIEEKKVLIKKCNEWGTYMSSSTYTDSRHVWFGVEYYSDKDDIENIADDNPPYREYGYGYRLVRDR